MANVGGLYFWTQKDFNMLVQMLTNIEQRLAAMQNLQLQTQANVKTIQTQEKTMAVDISALTAEIARNTSIEQSVIALIQGLAAQIAAIPASTDPTTQAALDALKQTLSANDDAIAAAVAQNTPVLAPAPASEAAAAKHG